MRKEARDLLEQVLELGKALEDVPAEIREPAFSLLVGYLSKPGGTSAAQRLTDSRPPEIAQDQVRDILKDLVSRVDANAPADNVRLIAAAHFACFGDAPFTVDEVREIGRENGLVLPKRPDMTLKGAGQSGKPFFYSSGKGIFRPTVHGELFFRDEYQVRKGVASKPSPKD